MVHLLLAIPLRAFEETKGLCSYGTYIPEKKVKPVYKQFQGESLSASVINMCLWAR